MSKASHNHEGTHHSHPHSDCGHGGHSHALSDNMALAFFLNLGFSIVELVGGMFTGSYAVLADAVHDLGDTVTIGIAWRLEKLSNKRPDRQYSFGYKRLSLLGSVITGTILITGSLAVLVGAIPKLFSPTTPETGGMIGLALLGVAVNGFAFYRMSKDGSHNAKMLRLHLLEDAAGWIIVLIGAMVIHFTGWGLLDPLLAAALAIYIGIRASKQLQKVLQIFLQKAPEDLNVDQLTLEMLKTHGVKEIHDLHVWSLDHEQAVLTCHVVASESADFTVLKSSIKKVIARFGNIHPTIEVESELEHCEQDCSHS